MSAFPPDDWFGVPPPSNISVGEGSWVWSSYAFLHYRSAEAVGVRIGRHSGVYAGGVFELGPHGEVRIGDYCALVAPVISTNGLVSIGDHGLISFGVVLADSSFALPPTERPLHRSVEERSPDLVLEDNVWVGARAVVAGAVRIGEGSVIGAGSVVDFDVPPFSIVAGLPARVVGTLR